jgi:membrane dipeptidase
VIASHSNSRKICPSSRNLTDEMFRAICNTGGVAGFNLFADFIGEKPTLDTACDHIFHLLELDPAGTHIAIGGDLDGISAMPEGFRGVQDYPKLAKRLLERGLDETLLNQIFWSNALGVIDKCSM